MNILRDRVLRRLVIEPETGCLLWQGALTTGGYGHIAAPGVTPGGKAAVHRLMYEWFVGPIPDGMELDHLCRVRRCASPAHLEPVSRRTNLLRGRTLAAANAAVTHCPHGHAYDEDNTYIDNVGSRRCRTCLRGRKTS